MQTQGIVPMILPVHIVAGVLALVFGYVALYATKGATLHRKSGMLFVVRDGHDVAQWRVDGRPENVAHIGQRGCGSADLLFRDDRAAHGPAAPAGVFLDGWRRRAVCAGGQRSRVHVRFRAVGQSADPRRPRASSLASSGCWQRQATFAMMRAGGIQGRASDRPPLVAHVFCDVGCRRLVFLGPATASARADPHPCASSRCRAVADRRHVVLAVAHPRHTADGDTALHVADASFARLGIAARECFAMRMILLVHILAGGLGLLSGYVALSATKGAPLHRKIGMLFVCVMLTMSVTGLLISAVEGVAPAINIPTGVADVLPGDHVADHRPASRCRLASAGYRGHADGVGDRSGLLRARGSARSPKAAARPGWRIRCSCLVWSHCWGAQAIVG